MNAKKLAMPVLAALAAVALGAGLLYSQAGPVPDESRPPAAQAPAGKAAADAEAAEQRLASMPASLVPDRLVRAYLGIGSIRARFFPPEGTKCCVLAVAKFKDRKFLNYARANLPVDGFHSGKPYEAELGWGIKDGKAGYFLAEQLGQVSFQPDDFFNRAYVTVHLTDNHQPKHKLGPFYVLGYTFEGSKTPNPSSAVKYDGLDVREQIQRGEQVAVFLMRPFASFEEAGAFSRALPKLTGE